MFSLGSFLFINSIDKKKILGQIRLLKSLVGLQHVEIWWEHGWWTDDDARWLDRQLGAWERIMHAPYLNMSFVSTHKEQNETSLSVLKKVVDQAKLMKVKVMTIHLGDRSFFIDDNEARKICRPYLEELIDYAGADLKISVENLIVQKGAQFGYPNFGREVKNLLAEIPGLFTTVDIGHSFKNNDNYSQFIKDCPDRIANVHLHNTDEKGVEHFGFNKPGGIKPSQVVRVLKEINYKGYLTLEIIYNEDIKKSWDIVKKQI